MIEADLETTKETEGPFVSFLPKVCILAGITDNEKTETLALSEIISLHSSDSDCRVCFVSVAESNTRFSVDSNGVFFRVSELHGASWRIVPATLHPASFTFATTPY